MPRRRLAPPDPFRVRLGVELLAARSVPSAGPDDPSPTEPVDVSPPPTPTAVVRTFSLQPDAGFWVGETFIISRFGAGAELAAQNTPSSETVYAVWVGGEAEFAAPGSASAPHDMEVRQPGAPELWAKRPPDATPPGPSGLLLPQPAPAAAPEPTPRTLAASPPPPDSWTGAGELWPAPRWAAVAVRSDPLPRSDTPRDTRTEMRSVWRPDTFPDRDPIDPSGLLSRAVWVGDPLPPRPVVHAGTQSHYEGGELRRPEPVGPPATPATPTASDSALPPADEVSELIARFAAEPAGNVPSVADPTPPPADARSDSWWQWSARLAGWVAAAWVAVRSVAASVRRSSPGERPDDDPPGALTDSGDRDPGRLSVETIDGS